MPTAVQPVAVQSFAERVRQEAAGLTGLKRTALEIIQINVGKLCNQACLHCHVDAGPQRTEIMDRRTAELALDLTRAANVQTVDITGGAPELNGSFRFLVEQTRRDGRHVIDRCNLTVLFEPGQEDLAEFLAAQRIEIIASLPCYSEENVTAQRGQDGFQQAALLRCFSRHRAQPHKHKRHDSPSADDWVTPGLEPTDERNSLFLTFQNGLLGHCVTVADKDYCPQCDCFPACVFLKEVSAARPKRPFPCSSTRRSSPHIDPAALTHWSVRSFPVCDLLLTYWEIHSLLPLAYKPLNCSTLIRFYRFSQLWNKNCFFAQTC